MNLAAHRDVIGHMSFFLPALVLVSLVFPVAGEGHLPASVYLGIQLVLAITGIVLAVTGKRLDGKPVRSAVVDLRVQAGLFLVMGAGVQFGFHRWPLLPLAYFLFFPITVFARRPSVIWLPALVPAMSAAGRYAFSRDMEMVPWAAAFLLFCVVLGIRMSRDHERMVSSQSRLDRLKSDAKEIMRRVQLEDRGEALDRIKSEEAAFAAALEEDDLLQKLLVWGCRFFGARTGILFVPEETGYYRMRAAAVHRGVQIVEELVPADKGFIHIASEQEGGVLCVSDARSAGSSLGFYSTRTEVGSFLVKVLYKEDWARDAREETGPGKIRCVLYFDSETVNDLTLDDFISKCLNEFGSLMLRAMGMAHVLQRMTTDMSVKDVIARYARSLTRSLKTEVIAEEALKAMMEALPRCDGAMVLFYEDGVLSVKATSGELVSGLKDTRILRDEASQVGLLLRRFSDIEGDGSGNGVSQAEILINYEQAKRSPFFHQGEKLGRITSFAAIPCYMGIQGGKISLKAAIVAVSRHANAFGREEVEDLRTLSGMMAPALDNAIQHQKVDELSRTDGLTNLLNHRTFQIILDGKINSMSRYGHSLAVVMVDADRFKMVNDTYGHPVGDEVLVELARRLKALVRKNDAVARYGGEEFAVVLDSVDEENARSIAEKMRMAIASAPFVTAAGTLSISASFGFSVLRKDDISTRREFLDQADQALYHAKQGGRNRVVSFSEIENASARRNPHTGTEGADVTGEVR